MTRAGPSANTAFGSGAASTSASQGGSASASAGYGEFGGYGFGTIKAHATTWDSLTPFDKPEDTKFIQEVAELAVSYDSVVSDMKSYAANINSKKIAYFPSGPNSNSYAFSFVEHLGIDRPTPVVGVPGWDQGL
jgi:hypothetical protein